MALNPSAMANEIFASIQNKSSAQDIHTSVGSALTTYLCNNTVVYFTWVGVNPSGTPDPVTTTSSSKLMGSFSCFPTNATAADTNGLSFGQQLQKGIASLKVVPPPTFSIPPASFAAVSPIVLTPTNMDSPLGHWEKWCDAVIKVFKTYINPTPLSGAHLAFTGVAVMTTIS